jgi:Nuclease A inhibitor-like protein
LIEGYAIKSASPESRSQSNFGNYAAGLNYQFDNQIVSRQKRKFLKSVMAFPTSQSRNLRDAFLQLIGEDPGTSVEKLAPEKFFRDLRPGNEDSEDQVAALQKAMTEGLRNLEGFRVGEIQIQIFVLGTDDTGKVVGLQTLSVET